MRKYLDQADCYIRMEPVRNLENEVTKYRQEHMLYTNMGSYHEAQVMFERLSEYENKHRRTGDVYQQREAMKLIILMDKDLTSDKYVKFIKVLMERFLGIHHKLPWIAFIRTVNDADIVTVYYSERDYYPNGKDRDEQVFFSSRKVLRKQDVSRKYFVKLIERSLEECSVYTSDSPVLHKLSYFGLFNKERRLRRRFNAMIRRIEGKLAELYNIINEYFAFTDTVEKIFIALIRTLQRRIDTLCSVTIGRRKYPALQNPDLVERKFTEIIDTQAGLCFNA